jgi:hypothetical protein
VVRPDVLTGPGVTRRRAARPGLTVGAVVLALVVSAVGAYLFVIRPRDAGPATSTSASTTSPTGTDPGTSTATSPTGTDPGTSTATGRATAPATSQATAPATTPATTPSVATRRPPTAAAAGRPPAGAVQLVPGLTTDPTARAAAGVLTRFFTAISRRRPRDAYALYSAAERNRQPDYPIWAAGYASTSYDEIVLTRVQRTAGGVVAHLRLRSRQRPAQAPDHASGCLLWGLAYRLVRGNVGPYRIDQVEPDLPEAEQPYRPC